MYCAKCGEKLNKNELYCFNCGAEIPAKEIENNKEQKVEDSNLQKCPNCLEVTVFESLGKCNNCNLILDIYEEVKNNKKELEIVKLISRQLKLDETDMYYLYGYTLPSFLIFVTIFLAFSLLLPGIGSILGIIIGSIVYAVTMKHYIVVLANSRLLLLNVDMKLKNIKQDKVLSFNGIERLNLKKGFISNKLLVESENKEKYSINIPQKAGGISRQKLGVEKLEELSNNLT